MKILKIITDFFFRRFRKKEEFFSEKICYIVEELLKVYRTSKEYKLLEFTINFRETSLEDIKKIKNKLKTYKNIVYIFEEKDKSIYLTVKIK